MQKEDTCPQFLDIAVLALQRLGLLAALSHPPSRRLTLLINVSRLAAPERSGGGFTFYVSRFKGIPGSLFGGIRSHSELFGVIRSSENEIPYEPHLASGILTQPPP